jgi:hypothetical protein
MDYNLLNKELLMEKFFGWYMGQYKQNPIALYINLIGLSDWNLFHPERNRDLLEKVYYGDKYNEYFKKNEFDEVIVVMRKFLEDHKMCVQ